jgi:hypothetical protein
MSNCLHICVKRHDHHWRCDECLRVFFPSGDTGAEQEAVRLRAALEQLRNDLRIVERQLKECDSLGQQLHAANNGLMALRARLRSR